MVNTKTLATVHLLSNAEIADRLDDVADLLDEQRANQYRVQAWRGGAATIRDLARPARELLAEEGLEGLDRLPGIGFALARAIRELVDTGRLSTLERLRGETDPAALLGSVPGIGSTLAARIHEELGIESLEELEQAAHDGRLAGIPGFGGKRLEGIRDALGTRLRTRRRRADGPSAPSVAELLDVDREYRERAEAGELTMIAPRRFNPARERWLPVLHTTRGDRHYTALFSNTANAHRLRRTHDWVVIYFDGRDGEQQCTVVTQQKGPLIHQRVVRGRESECARNFSRRLASA
ncbi:MAG TPA: helix-hairpin-helix domain-containing protein [Gemmatimonadaceae bacterium]|nr:helix-hairpin-helix domain-containing protein [Gemmatimonadaceae bacterium]